ncbi:hypothetical protein [Streptomyces sp. NPDC050704]|uniref:hypothetical protein n=1 Tax=Streptomyces sp. NPDC050704 TaxID=3157219 RepID=UPI00342E161E
MRLASAARALLAALTLPLAALALAGCGDPGDLRGSGPTATAVGPTRLWPEVPPATSPALDYGEADTETVKGVTAPGDDIRKVDPVDVIRAEIAAHPDEYTGVKAPYWETARQIEQCGKKDGEAGKDEKKTTETPETPETPETKGERGRACPVVLQPYYRDLTGDGRDDMVLGMRMPEDQLAVRAYTFVGHRLTEVMATTDSTLGVEIAGRDVIIRSPSKLAGYEYRTVWSWDRRQRAMLATKDEILRVGAEPGTSPAASPRSPAASPR